MSNCPKCNTPEWFSGIFGANCLNPNCSDFKNGSSSNITLQSSIRTVEAPKNITFYPGDRVLVHRGPDWDIPPTNDGYWMSGILENILNTRNEIQYEVRLDPGFYSSGGDCLDGIIWSATEGNIKKFA